MRLKIDENLHDDVADLLAGDGHEVETVHTEGLRSCGDQVLADHCRAEGRTLITLDLDFADIRAFPPRLHAGMIVLRLGNQSRAHVLHVMSGLLSLLQREPLIGRLWIVSESNVRIREG
jgi:predicted nuclease of predicted toxin-antitoxin system